MDIFINPNYDYEFFRRSPLVTKNPDIKILAQYDKHQLRQQVIQSRQRIISDSFLPQTWCLACYDYYLNNLHDYAIVSLYTQEIGYTSYYRFRQGKATAWDLSFDKQLRNIIKKMPHPDINFVAYRGNHRFTGNDFLFDYPSSATFHLVYTRDYLPDTDGNIYRVHIDKRAHVIFHLSQCQIILAPSAFLGFGKEYHQPFDVYTFTGVAQQEENPFWLQGYHHFLEERGLIPSDENYDQYIIWYENQEGGIITSPEEQDWLDRNEFNSLFSFKQTYYGVMFNTSHNYK